MDKIAVVRITDPEWLEELDDELFEEKSLNERRAWVSRTKAREEKRALEKLALEAKTE